MKVLKSITIGALIGVAAVATTLMVPSINNTAHGEINWLDNAVASGNWFEWNDLFSPSSKGQGIYKLVYEKTISSPKKDALDDVARSFGLTKTEAQAVIDGSITPIYNNPDHKGGKLSKEEALNIALDLQETFEFVLELYDVQNQVDVATAPSEIFANGDLSDAGFDLVYDLSIIEDILFNEITPTSMGTFGGELDKPYLPTDADTTNANYIATEGAQKVYKFEIDEIKKSISNENDGDLIPVNNADGANGDKFQKNVFGEAKLSLSEGKIDVTILSEDVCEPDGGILNALTDYNKTKNEAANGNAGSSDALLNSLFPTGDNADKKESFEQTELPVIAAAEWTDPWCEGISSADDIDGSVFGKTGFSSLGNAVSSALNNSIGASTSIDNEFITAQAAICFETKLIWKKVSKYQATDNCIECEIDKINDAINKTLSHSLTPNKATGNLMESAKCKQSYEPLVNMQFITIAAPIPTPASDNKVLERNIFDEWNKFVDRYQPEKFADLFEGSSKEDRIFSQLSGQAVSTQQDLLLSVQKSLAEDRAEAIKDIDNIVDAAKGRNTLEYSQVILGEINQLTGFFNAYNQQYRKVGSEICPAIKSKKSA